MSLHKFAEQVAAHGRGEDSLLIHMTPDEVNRLQEFAQANGRSLTINPHTGLPEAGMLSDLFKAVAPIALGAFLGPGAFGIAGLGLSAGTAGLITGGLTSLATGSLSRGLMAGLGAYGGAGMAEGLAGTGAGVLGQQASEATAMELANAGAGEGLTGEAYNKAFQQSVTDKMAALTPEAKMSAGFDVAKAAPMDYLKNNWSPVAAAALPVLSSIQTTTPGPKASPVDTGYIRQKLYDPYTQTYKSLAPVKASEWGNRSFSDAYTNPQTGIATLDQRPPTPMATGGIVALADGGPPTMLSDEELFKQTGSWEAAAAARDAQNNALNQYNWAQQAAATPVVPDASAWWESQPGGLNAMYDTINKQLATTPNMTDAQVDAAMKQYGISSEDVHNALQKGGGSQAEEWSLGAGNLGLAGLNKSITDAYSSYVGNKANTAKSVADQRTDAYNAMLAAGMNEADVVRATGKTIAQLFPEAIKKVTPPPLICGPGFELNADGTACVPVKGTTKTDTSTITDTTIHTCPSGYHWDPAANACVLNTSATQNTTEVVTTPTSLVTAPATTLPVGVSGTTGPSIEGGGATVNPNGTITTSPVIPGIPVGGFTGMEQLRDVYTKGGGSLGYVPQAPRTMAEFEQMYNKQTGDSLAAYNYLMGKGGASYPTQSIAANTGIQRPYWSAGMKYKPKFLSLGKDGSIQSSTTSGNAAATTGTGSLTSAKTINVLNNQGQTETATLSSDGNYYTSGGDAYDVSGAPVMAKAAGGMTGYAVGGGLGSLGSYSDGGRLLKGPGDGVSDSIPATIGAKQQPARLADGEFVVPARIVSELGNGSTEAGAKKLYAMMDRVQKARGKTTGKNKVAANTRADKYLPA